MASTSSMTERLQMFMRGDPAETDALLREILPTLRRMASRAVKQMPSAQLSKTELVNELWIREFSKGGWQLNDRKHFFALASHAMRHILIDAARKLMAERRRGEVVLLSGNEAELVGGTSVREAEQIIEIGILTDRLRVEIPDAACIVEMRYFAGFTLDEIAMETGLTKRQVRKRWEKGVDWLKRATRRKPRDLSFGLEGDV